MAPWTVVRADDKRLARLNVIKDLLCRLDYDGKDEAWCFRTRTWSSRTMRPVSSAA